MIRVFAVLLWTLTSLTVPAPPAFSADCDASGTGSGALESELLRVATLNVAHGRGNGPNQMLLDAATIRENLLAVGGLLDRAAADVVALQEADAASAWSGDFNHVEFLLQHTGYRCAIHGLHASNRAYEFGTAMLSPHPLDGGFVHSFAPSKPTTTKGFVTAALQWNPGGALEQPLRVVIVSVHLDFSRRSVRHSQIEEMIRVLGKLKDPLVVMGDFNTDWASEGSSLKYLAEQLDLHVFQPQADGLGTYDDSKTRLDWILISGELAFRRYAVYPEVVSDHAGVLAEIALISTQ